MTKSLQVGIIGASADRGWAKISHAPAVQQLMGLKLGAVVAGSQAKSDAVAKAFGARAAYGDAKDLFGDREIDIFSICVKFQITAGWFWAPSQQVSMFTASGRSAVTLTRPESLRLQHGPPEFM